LAAGQQQVLVWGEKNSRVCFLQQLCCFQGCQQCGGAEAGTGRLLLRRRVLCRQLPLPLCTLQQQQTGSLQLLARLECLGFWGVLQFGSVQNNSG
jgi:hypothetical protein